LVLTVGFLTLGWLAPGCGADRPQAPPCRSGIPDFEVLITAADGPLPEDLLVRLEYGGGEEEYVLANPGTQAVIFCRHSDRNRNVLLGDGGAGGEAGASGHGGAASVHDVEALLCQIWSFGSARGVVETAAYPMTMPLELTRKQGVCTVKADLELSLPDGGVGSGP
jgi:hypothetical protein